MRFERIKQIKVITTADPEQFESDVNKSMTDLRELKPELVIHTVQPFTAVIQYEKEERILETVKDEFHENGIRYTCLDCPHLDRPMDGRIKWAYCKYSPYGKTHINDDACEFFYKELACGKAKPVR